MSESKLFLQSFYTQIKYSLGYASNYWTQTAASILRGRESRSNYYYSTIIILGHLMLTIRNCNSKTSNSDIDAIIPEIELDLQNIHWNQFHPMPINLILKAISKCSPIWYGGMDAKKIHRQNSSCRIVGVQTYVKDIIVGKKTKERVLINTMKTRKLTYCDHVSRGEKYGMFPDYTEKSIRKEEHRKTKHFLFKKLIMLLVFIVFYCSFIVI